MTHVPYVLDAFGTIAKKIRFFPTPCLSVRLWHMTIRESLSGFSRNLILRSFTQICRHVHEATHVLQRRNDLENAWGIPSQTPLPCDPWDFSLWLRHHQRDKRHSQRSKGMLWWNRQLAITICATHKWAFINWKSRSNNRANSQPFYRRSLLYRE
jgi:hypothetical protein